MHTRYRRIALVAALALLVALVAPAAVTAAPAKASVAPLLVKPDAYEPDDTTATAKAFPEEMPETSIHSFTNTYDADGDLVRDIDSFTVTAETTGQPFVIEARQLSGWFACMMAAAETSASGEQVTIATSRGVWGLTIGNTLMFRAPHPGTFLVGVIPALFGNGTYTLHVSTGIAGRLSGADRYATAAEVSKLMWPNAANPLGQFIGQIEDTSAIGPAGCVLARGDEFADALAGAAFAGMSDTAMPLSGAVAMPVLLTQTGYVPPATYWEVKRLSEERLNTTQPFTVYLLGGESAISSEVELQLQALNNDLPLTERLRIVRIAGANRFDTAAKIASAECSSALGTGDTAFVVNGYSFADALAAAPVASWARGPVLMTKQASLPAETKAFLTAHPEMHYIVIAGSSSTVSTDVIDELEAAPLSREVLRLGGADRYETAALFARLGVDEFGMNPGTFMVVSGTRFPDGLSAAPLTAFNGGPLLLTKAGALPDAVRDYYADYSGDPRGLELPIYVVGGESSVGADVFAELDGLWDTP